MNYYDYRLKLYYLFLCIILLTAAYFLNRVHQNFATLQPKLPHSVLYSASKVPISFKLGQRLLNHCTKEVESRAGIAWLSELLKQRQLNLSTDEMLHIIAHPKMSRKILHAIALHQRPTAQTDIAIATHKKVGPQAMAAIVKRTGNQSLLLIAATNPNITTANLLAIQAKLTEPLGLQVILQQAPDKLTPELLTQVSSRPIANPTILEDIIAKQPDNNTVHAAVIKNPNVTDKILACIEQHSASPKILSAIAKHAKKKKKLQPKNDNQLAVATTNNQSSPDKGFYIILSPVLYHGGFKHLYGDQIFASKNYGAELYAGYNLNDNFGVGVGFIKTITKGGDVSLPPGTVLPGHINNNNQNNMILLIESKIKQQLMFVGVSCQTNLTTNSRLLTFAGLGYLKFNAQYTGVGHATPGAAPIFYTDAEKSTFNFIKSKFVPIFKFGLNYNVTKYFGFRCALAWCRSLGTTVMAQENQSQLLILKNSYTLSLGWKFSY